MQLRKLTAEATKKTNLANLVNRLNELSLFFSLEAIIPCLGKEINWYLWTEKPLTDYFFVKLLGHNQERASENSIFNGQGITLVRYLRPKKDLLGLLPNSIFCPFSLFSTNRAKKAHKDTPHICSLFSHGLLPKRFEKSIALPKLLIKSRAKERSKREFGSRP